MRSSRDSNTQPHAPLVRPNARSCLRSAAVAKCPSPRTRQSTKVVCTSPVWSPACAATRSSAPQSKTTQPKPRARAKHWPNAYANKAQSACSPNSYNARKFPNRFMSSSQPLAGRTIVITRARAQAAEFAALLEGYGARVVACPTIEIVEPETYAPLDEALE